ncbi:hypothetical protein QYG20_12125 [Xanthomonas euvesicatoria]|uniref:hypothetical protein n=1 Tax=Xanthomonas euvesicatoria TaxID=456327 RepID=UPI0032B36614
MMDFSEVSFIKRIVVGSDNPAKMQTAEQVEAAQQLLNRCLSAAPRGAILGIEKSFNILQLGEHQVVLQWLCYHVGFKRKPVWLTEA